MCTMPVFGPAPCQCFSPGGIHTVSPALISRIGPPFACTRPTPEMTCSVCPSGWVCHAVRAPGSKLTRPARMHAGAGASMIGSCHTTPVNESFGCRRVGTDPLALISIGLPPCRLDNDRSRTAHEQGSTRGFTMLQTKGPASLPGLARLECRLALLRLLDRREQPVAAACAGEGPHLGGLLRRIGAVGGLAGRTIDVAVLQR